jgi:hypothetical protein
MLEQFKMHQVSPGWHSLVFEARLVKTGLTGPPDWFALSAQRSACSANLHECVLV